MSHRIGLPPKQGLYDPKNEHDACGIGFVVNIKGQKSNKIVDQALDLRSQEVVLRTVGQAVSGQASG